MAVAPKPSETESKVKVLEMYARDLENEIASLRCQVTAWPAFALAVAAISLPLYGRAEDAGETTDRWSSLWSLASHADDAGNGAVQTFAVITILAVIALGLAALAMAFSRAWIAGTATGAITLVAWLGLTIVVGSSGGDGAIGDLGFENTIRILLIPIAALATLAAARAAKLADG